MGTLESHVKARRVLRAKRTPLITRLLDAFSGWNYGLTDQATRRYAFKPATILSMYNDRRRWKKLSGADLVNHWNGLETFYYFSSIRADEILVNLDFDAKGVGSYQGCVKAAEHINTKYFDGKLFCEDSTHQTGIHGYFWLTVKGHSPEQVNAGLDRLQELLRQDLQQAGADISGLDVQGTCAVIEWTYFKGRRFMSKFVNGRLAKVPRTAREREAELLGAAVVPLHALGRAKNPHADPLDQVRVWTPKERQASSYGCAMTDADFAALETYGDVCRQLFRRYNDGQPLQAPRRYRVRASHGAIMLCIMRWVYDHPNADGSFLQARAEALWRQAHDRGYVTEAWNNHVWTAFRDFLSSLGLIDWQNNLYTPPTTTPQGEKRAGKGCRWGLTDQFARHLQAVQTGGGSLEVQITLPISGEVIVPVKILRCPRPDELPDDLEALKALPDADEQIRRILAN